MRWNREKKTWRLLVDSKVVGEVSNELVLGLFVARFWGVDGNPTKLEAIAWSSHKSAAAEELLKQISSMKEAA